MDRYKLKYNKDFYDYENDNKIDVNIKQCIKKVLDFLQVGNFKSADVKKLKGTNFNRAKINKKARILLMNDYKKSVIYLVELILDHDYSTSKYLNNKEFIIENFNEYEEVEEFPNRDNEKTFRMINNKPIFFNHSQENILTSEPPMMIIGSAGSGKTTVTIEKLKLLSGKVLYTSFAKNLVENSKKLCGECSNIEFLTFHDFLNNVENQKKDEITFDKFKTWALKHKVKEIEKQYEEFKGVITGGYSEAYLSLDNYLSLGVKKSIFLENQRFTVYELFEKYLKFLKENNFYDSNILSFELLKNVSKVYDFIVIDEIQDFTNVQIYLIIQTLKKNKEKNFIFSGDSNQIVYSNFFSWSNLQEMLFHTNEDMNIKILETNYRNSKKITEISNKILKIKQLRFGSIDKESNYLMKSVSSLDGKIHFYKQNSSNIEILDKNTKDSVNVAVVVMNEESKKEVKQHFSTTLVFTIQEAKGLEYHSVILYNFVSNSHKIFSDIVDNISKSDLTKAVEYARVKNKENKDLEIFKVYINSLYVALTRGINTIYIIEQDNKHKLLELLELVEEKKIKINIEVSTDKEWLEKAKTLRENNNIEQAEAIEAKEKLKKDKNKFIDKHRLNSKMKPKLNILEKNYEIEKKIFFELKMPSKKEKTSYFKIAKSEDDLTSIKKLANELKFKTAIQYLKKYYDNLLKETIGKQNINLLENLTSENISLKNIKIIENIKISNIDFLKILIENNADINSSGDDGIRPLVFAIKKNKNKIAKLLIENGADIKSIDIHGITPLLYAIDSSNIEISKLLINSGANVNAKSKNDSVALITASYNGLTDVVELLLKNELIDINIRGMHERTALMTAAQENHIEVAKLLLVNKKLDINIQDTDGVTALGLASSSEMIKLLVKNSADVNIINNQNVNVLLRAIQNKIDDEAIELLLNKTKDVNVKRKADGSTSLLCATANCNEKLVSKLLENGANVNIYDNYKQTPLITSMLCKDMTIARLLIERGAEAITSNVKLLITAVSYGNLEAVKYLISKGFDLNDKDSENKTALVTASEVGNYEIVKYLLDYIDDINIKANNGDTALLIASYKGNLKIVELLLRNAANTNIKNDKQDTALSFAVSQQHFDIVKLLIQHNADVNVINNQGATPLLIAATRENIEILKLLLDNGADKNILVNNKTAYDYALENNKIMDKEVLKRLAI